MVFLLLALLAGPGEVKVIDSLAVLDEAVEALGKVQGVGGDEAGAALGIILAARRSK